MTRHVRSWAIAALAASTLVVSATAQAGLIRYDITNAISVQGGYSLSGYVEVSATGTDASLSSFNLTATKLDNPTLTFSSGTGDISGAVNLHATDSALYVPVGATLNIFKENSTRDLNWVNSYYTMTKYSARDNMESFNFWYSETFPVTDNNGWKIGSAQSAAVPEIDPATGGSALSLVAGVLAMIEQRRRRSTLVA